MGSSEKGDRPERAIRGHLNLKHQECQSITLSGSPLRSLFSTPHHHAHQVAGGTGRARNMERSRRNEVLVRNSSNPCAKKLDQRPPASTQTPPPCDESAKHLHLQHFSGRKRRQPESCNSGLAVGGYSGVLEKRCVRPFSRPECLRLGHWSAPSSLLQARTLHPSLCSGRDQRQTLEPFDHSTPHTELLSTAPLSHPSMNPLP